MTLVREAGYRLPSGSLENRTCPVRASTAMAENLAASACWVPAVVRISAAISARTLRHKTEFFEDRPLASCIPTTIPNYRPQRGQTLRARLGWARNSNRSVRDRYADRLCRNGLERFALNSFSRGDCHPG